MNYVLRYLQYEQSEINTHVMTCTACLVVVNCGVNATLCTLSGQRQSGQRTDVLRVQERSSEMWTPRSLKLETRSASVLI